MTPDAILYWARAAERLAVILISGLALILGWDLFRRGVVESQSAEMKYQHWSFRLTKVGPGIFFALFATAAFITAVTHPLSITKPMENGTSSRAVQPEQEKINYGGSIRQDADDKLAVEALNTTITVVFPKSRLTDQKEIRAASRAKDILMQRKRELMFQKFGSLSAQYFQLHDKIISDPNALRRTDADFQAKYQEMESWDIATLLKEP